MRRRGTSAEPPLAPAATCEGGRRFWLDASRGKEAIQIGDVEPEQMAELVECDATLINEPAHEPLTHIQVFSRFRKREGRFSVWTRRPTDATTGVRAVRLGPHLPPDHG